MAHLQSLSQKKIYTKSAFINGIMPEACIINKMTDLQKTKFLLLLSFIMGIISVHVPKCN
jgi:hypothetical protein